MKIYITQNETGLRCREWAEKNLPKGYFLTGDINADIVFSIYEKKLFDKKFLEGKKIFNFHHGILPDYRGTGTHTWAIVNGEKEFGITLHEIDKGIDSGAIIDIFTYPIEPDDTAELLVLKGNEIVLVMFKKWFSDLLKGNYRAEPQKLKGNLYQRKDLERLKDLTPIIRGFTFKGKEPAFYDNASGQRIYLVFYPDEEIKP